MVVADIQAKEELVQIAGTFYPIVEVGGKLFAALDDLWQEYLEAKERLADDPPRYIG